MFPPATPGSTLNEHPDAGIAYIRVSIDTRIANGDNGQEEKDSVAADTTVAQKEVAKAVPSINTMKRLSFAPFTRW